MQKLIIYTKLNCHLCEQAYHMLVDIAYDTPLKIDVTDISQPHNKNFSEKYSELIPVIAKSGAKAELAWPFTPDDIKDYLGH